MKKTFLLISSVITLLCTLNSCGSSTNSNDLDLDKTLKFSTQTVEQQKQNIQQNGIDLTTKIDALQNSKALIALQAFSKNSTGSPAFVKPFSQLKANLLTNKVSALETFNQQMRTAAAVGDDIWGVWTWNPNKEDFDHVSSTTKTATFLFPATENSKSNTGELKITYAPSDVIAPNTNPVEYMPKSFSAVLKVDGVVAMDAEFSGSYKSDATPTNVTQTLVIEKYNWNLQLTNNDKDVSAKYTFNYDSDVLLKYEVGASGSLTAKAIEASNGLSDILTSGAMYFQVMDIAFLGGINDFKGFTNEMNAIQDTNTKSSYDSEALIINKYLKMYGCFVKENLKFADVQFYVLDNSYSYYWDNQKYTEYSYSVEPRFVLSDGSLVTIENFVKTGFEDLITKLQSYQ